MSAELSQSSHSDSKTSNQSPQPISKDENPSIKVLRIIIKFYISHFKFYPGLLEMNDPNPYLAPSIDSTQALLRLRLVCKDWAEAVLPLVFNSICLNRSRKIQSLIENWKDSVLDSDSSPVQRLYIENLVYGKKKTSEEELKDWSMYTVPMNHASELILFLGQNLTDLTLELYSSMGFSPDLINAIGQIKCLTSLTIRSCAATTSTTNLESLVDLLNVTTDLESLSILIRHLEIFELKPGALSKLKHLRFEDHPNNKRAIDHLCQSTKKSLKVIESKNPEGGLVLEPLNENLECLITIFFPDHLPHKLSKMRFPKLRIIYSTLMYRQSWGSLDWLQWPFCSNLRTLVMDFESGKLFWDKALVKLGHGHLVKPPNLKHFVFLSIKQDPTIEVERLVRTLKIHGIESHFTCKLNYAEILDLDEKLHGPINE